ncbi:MAG: 3'(2'),5'-bisphosphate nucleotidase CysQ [Deltaproteobacteria bacterium]|nr:3'(2'),5'-bisphosphate nucleotidase CysQ [Deltaproteobacteria bacterium]
MTGMDLNRALTTAREAAERAGDKLLFYYASNYDIGHKRGGSPVTTADIEANQVLHDALLGAFPETGWLSEESADGPERLRQEWVWIVDPLDGTMEFIRGVDEFAVSVALVQGTAPAVAVAYNPATGCMTHCRRGFGTFANGKPVHVSSRAELEGATMVASRSETRRGLFAGFEGILKIRPTGSIAHKLAEFAGGRGDLIVSLRPKNEWDVCAGVLLAEEAGAKVTDLDGRPFSFNQADTLRNGVIAANPSLYPEVYRLVAEQRR